MDFYFGIDNLEDFFDDKVDRSGKEIINTPLGSFDRRRVETFYLNKGRSSTPSKARHQLFYYNEYDSSKLETYSQSTDCYVKECKEICFLKKGDRMKLNKFQRKNSKANATKVKGTVLYLSKSHAPLQISSISVADGNLKIKSKLKFFPKFSRSLRKNFTSTEKN